VKDLNRPVCREAPEILDLEEASDRSRFAHLIAGGSGAVEIHDSIDEQLRDYVKVLHPSCRDERRIGDEINELLDGCQPRDFGRWAFYPWSRRLVHILPPEPFGAVRESRNLYKIDLEERRRLRGFNVGIVGLSAGSAVARTLCLEGIGGTLRIADFDALDLSNLNRLQAGIHEIGVNKAVICARQMYEVNPYAHVEVFAEGVTRENLALFLAGPPRLDVLIDECDSIDMKFLLREEARANRIPVIMQTSDRGMLDIERFDLEPQRAVLHGLVGAMRSSDLAELTMEQKVEHVLCILPPREVSARAAASMLEIGSTISTWPQLASDIQFGGALVTVALRHLCLGLPLESGRWYFEMDQLLRAPAKPLNGSLRHQDDAPRRMSSSASRSFAETLVAYATLAPSGGNCQPWRFSLDGDALLVARHPTATESFRDIGGLASYLAIGGAIENAVIAASEHGRVVEVALRPQIGDDGTVARLCWDAAAIMPARSSERLALIERRMTNRRMGSSTPLEDDDAATLRAAVGNRVAHLELVSDLAARGRVGRILGAFDRLQFTVSQLHAEAMSEMRWDSEAAQRTLDGIDLATLELSRRDALILQLIARPDVAAILRTPGRGRALEEPAAKAMASSSAAGMLRVNGSTAAAFVEGGRAMQRVWLEATRVGLALQPWTAITFVSRLLGTPRQEIFTAGEAKELRELGKSLDEVFRERRDWTPAIVFRIFRAETPSVRSRRRPIESVFPLAKSR
jgi:molybdopterin/thiamine biosynthesis adenylyltransferase/nitroreductase